MNSKEFKKDFIESIKTAATVTGEGSCASFVENMSQYLIEADALTDFTPSFFKGKNGRYQYRVDGYVYDDFDNVMTIVIADFDGNDLERKLTGAEANKNFGLLSKFLDTTFNTSLHQEIEMSTPCADLVDFLRSNKNRIRRYRFLLFTDAEMSASIKKIEIEDYNSVPIEGQIWDIERMFRVCCSEQGRQTIEINFKDYCDQGIPCIEASSAATEQYISYLGVIPGTVLADIYDSYGSKLLEGNVRSFLSTKVAVNKKIRSTILNTPQMFFAFNNGISATAKDVEIEDTKSGRFITYVKDFQIINGGQTTASISNARYRDKNDLSSIFVQMKLTSIDESKPEESDELIRSISRSSNSQNKVSDSDFFASHPFHRRMEQISRRLFAPATNGAQYETKWFYERARGQYLQEQMRLSQARKKQFELQNPKYKVIRKTDLAKVQNTWRGYPDVVSKGAQTNFNSFAEFIDAQWNTNEEQFNERYFQITASLIILFQYLEKTISKQPWYEGGYRANIIYYTVAQFRRLIHSQFPGKELDLIMIWNRQDILEPLKNVLISLAEKVLKKITDPSRKVVNVTQWCKRNECWQEVQKIYVDLPKEMESCLITIDEQKSSQKFAKSEQKVVNEIQIQTTVVNYSVHMWRKLSEFVVKNHMVTPTDVTALKMACQMPNKLPTTFQCKRLLALLDKASQEGFNREEFN